MQLILLIVVGFLAAFIARAIMPDRQMMSLGMMTSVGIVGSLVGGFLSSLFSRQPVSLLRPGGIITGVFGATILLGISLAVRNRRTHALV